jgi:malonyl-CoA/methylmalonyl-CoA synthetase
MSGDENVIAALYEGRARQSVLFIQPNGDRLASEQAFRRLKGMARFLSDQGVQAGDRISLRLDKSLDAVLLAHAVMWLGAIACPLNTAYTDHEVTLLLDDAKSKILICDKPEVGRFRPIADKVAAELLTLPFPEDALVKPPRTVALTGGKSPAALLYTSGTTGKPKGALISHKNLLHSARSLASIWRLSPSDTLLHPLPVYHAHGLLTSINTMLASGGSVLLLPGFDVRETIASMQTCTAMMAVPTHYSRILEEPTFGRDTIGQLRLAISGSAPLPLGLASEFKQRTGVPIIERYGSTEAAIVTALPAEEENRAGWVGWPLPNVDVQIRDSNGRTHKHGIGVLETRGPNVFVGYWNNETASCAAFNDGWFSTGDVAEIDYEGCVKLLGREKDIVITGGLNVYPAEVENALRQLHEVKDAAVFGVPHPDFGEAVIAAVELKDPTSKADQKLMQSALRTTLASYKIPKSILATQALPRNLMGKLLKGQLREAHWEIFIKQQQ